jgi:hypothetical protein
MTINSTAKSNRHGNPRHEQMSLLKVLEENTKTSRKIALLRRRFLQDDKVDDEDGHDAGGCCLGLAAAMLQLLEEAVDCFVQHCIMTTMSHDDDDDDDDENENNTSRPQQQQQQLPRICGKSSMIFLERILQVHLACAKLDSVLAEELGRQGTHAQLVRLLRLSDMLDDDDVALETMFPLEADLDAFVWIQDLAGEIAALSATFPLKTSPFSVETLKSRLPLRFTIASPIIMDDDDDSGTTSDGSSSISRHVVENVLIHQVCTRRQSAQEDVGFGTCVYMSSFYHLASVFRH